MLRKKSLFLAACCLAFTFALSACGKKTESVSEVPTVSAVSEATSTAMDSQNSEPKTIGDTSSKEEIMEILKRSKEYYNVNTGFEMGMKAEIMEKNMNMHVIRDKDGNTKSTLDQQPGFEQYFIAQDKNTGKNYIKTPQGAWVYQETTIPKQNGNDEKKILDPNFDALSDLSLKKENDDYRVTGTLPLKNLKGSSLDFGKTQNPFNLDNANVDINLLIDSKDYHFKEFTLDMTKLFKEAFKAQKQSQTLPNVNFVMTLIDIKPYDQKIELPAEAKNAKPMNSQGLPNQSNVLPNQRGNN